MPGAVLFAALTLTLPYALKDAAITGLVANGIVKATRQSLGSTIAQLCGQSRNGPFGELAGGRAGEANSLENCSDLITLLGEQRGHCFKSRFIAVGVVFFGI